MFRLSQRISRKFVWISTVAGAVAVGGEMTAALGQENPPTSEAQITDEGAQLPPTVVEAERPETPPAPPPAPQPPQEQPAWSPFNPAYGLDVGSTAAKTDVPLSETPISVQIIPQAVIEDQAAQGIEDIYLNASGVSQAGNTLNAQSEVLPFIRGFESRFLFRNGLRATSVGAVDPVNIERVEILKGPASVLYGAIQPGGIVNYVTKKPMPGQYYKVKQQVGSYDHLRTTLDYNNVVTEDETVLFRINSAYTSSDSFRDFIELDRGVVAPSLSFRPDDDTELTFDFSWSREVLPYDTGTPLGFNNEQLVPINTFFNDPSLEGRDLEDFFYAVSLNRELSDDVTWRTHFLAHRVNAKNESLRPRGLIGTPGNEILRLRYQHEDRTDDGFQLVSDLVLRWDGDFASHTVVAGADVLHETSAFARFRENAPNVPVTPNPNVQYTPSTLAFNNFLYTDQTWVGTYLQDQITFGDRLHLLIGGRFDYVESGANTDGVDAPNFYDSALTGRIGMLYELNDVTSPFFSVSQSFFPQSPGTLDEVGNPLKPETGMQYEGGFKFESLDGRLFASAVGYYIEKSEVAQSDPTFTFFFPGVSQRSQGFEFDLMGQLSETLSIIGNYAYTDTKVVGDLNTPANVGTRLGNVPLHMTRVWLTFNTPEGAPLEGFGFGGGPRHQSENLAQFDTTVVLDEYIYFDAGLWYRQPHGDGPAWQFQLNFHNLFDTEYVARASTRDITHPGVPFTVIASAGVEY